MLPAATLPIPDWIPAAIDPATTPLAPNPIAESANGAIIVDAVAVTAIVANAFLIELSILKTKKDFQSNSKV